MDAKTKATLERVKRDINSAIDDIAKQCPEMADHLRKHIVFDEEKGTVCYTGDIKWNLSPPPNIDNSRQAVIQEMDIDTARRKLDFIRQQVSVDLFNCRYRQIERDIEWIREKVGKGELTFEVIGTSDEELKKLDKGAFERREKN